MKEVRISDLITMLESYQAEIRGGVMGKQRAIEMLRIAAKYIRDYYPDGIIHYDDAECDGYCVADDCESAADGLVE